MLTTADIQRAYTDERWLGWGYLGERQRTISSEPHGEPLPTVALADAEILRLANERGWTYEQLFGWLNSRLGRHFADQVLGWTGTVLRHRVERACGHGLFAEVAPE